MVHYCFGSVSEERGALILQCFHLGLLMQTKSSFTTGTPSSRAHNPRKNEMATHNPYELLGRICWPRRIAAYGELQLCLAAIWGLRLFVATLLVLPSTLDLHHLLCVC